MGLFDFKQSPLSDLNVKIHYLCSWSNVIKIIELHPGGAVLEITCKMTWIIIKKEKENKINDIGKNIFNGKSVVDKIGLAKLYATNSGMNLSESNIFVEDLEPMYMNMGESKVSNVPATQVLRVSSSNVNNNYMNETPSLFGFSDLVYT